MQVSGENIFMKSTCIHLTQKLLATQVLLSSFLVFISLDSLGLNVKLTQMNVPLILVMVMPLVKTQLMVSSANVLLVSMLAIL